MKSYTILFLHSLIHFLKNCFCILKNYYFKNYIYILVVIVVAVEKWKTLLIVHRITKSRPQGLWIICGKLAWLWKKPIRRQSYPQFPQADFCSICGNVENFFLIAVVKRDTLFKC